VVEVDFQWAMVSMPTITPPILTLRGFSVRGWRYIMGMAFDMEFISINIFILKVLFCYFCFA